MSGVKYYLLFPYGWQKNNLFCAICAEQKQNIKIVVFVFLKGLNQQHKGKHNTRCV